MLGMALVFASIAAPARAQDDPRFALLMSFPSPTVSFQWEASEKFAVRVESSYSYRYDWQRSSTGDEPPRLTPQGTIVVIPTETVGETTSHTGSIGLAGVFTFHRTDQLRLYVAPRIAMSFSRQRLSATVTRTLPPGFPAGVFDVPGFEAELSSTAPGAGASFGATTNIHNRLALFGEAGFIYQRSDQPFGIIGGVTTILDGVLTTTTPSAPDEFRRTTVNTRAVAGVKFLF
jgi:hypothetical protein